MVWRRMVFFFVSFTSLLHGVKVMGTHFEKKNRINSGQCTIVRLDIYLKITIAS